MQEAHATLNSIDSDGNFKHVNTLGLLSDDNDLSRPFTQSQHNAAIFTKVAFCLQVSHCRAPNWCHSGSAASEGNPTLCPQHGLDLIHSFLPSSEITNVPASN